jgi:formate hydrogenlyase subunit 6/NADH:ubiquinone oxidoreductase subunit I
MAKRLSYLYLLPQLLRTVLTKPITVSYPYGPLELPEAYRGQIEVSLHSCAGCGMCARDCPSAAIEVERLDRGGVRIVHYFDRCGGCGQCVLSCQQGAIRLEPTFRSGAKSRDALRIEWVRVGDDAS